MMDVYILETSDVHAYIAPTDYLAGNTHCDLGLAKAATVIQKMRATHAHTIYIDNGDFLQGSPLAQYLALKNKDASPAPLFECLNQMGCDAFVIGNHEFNYGLEYLSKGMQAFHGPVLAANVTIGEEDYLIAAPYTVVERGGVRIAILGLVTHFVPKWEKPEHIRGVRFNDPIKVAKTWVPRLRSVADVVVVAYHGGFERDPITGQKMGLQTGENAAWRMLQEVPGIDVLLTGHQHRRYSGSETGIPVTQPGWRGESVGCIRLSLERIDGVVRVQEAEATLLSVKGVSPDPAMMAYTASLQDSVEDWLDVPIGNIRGDMLITDPLQACITGPPYIDFINRLQMKAANVDISAAALFSQYAPGLPSEVTVRHVVNNYVYANTLVVLEVSGADLRAALERCARFFAIGADGKLKISEEFSEPFEQYYSYDMYAGIDYDMDIRRPPGERITRLLYHGEPITAEQKLRIVVNNFRATGGGEYTMYDMSKAIGGIEVDMTDLIVEYLQTHPVLTPRTMDNFRVLH